jgi:hypothetical protein
MGRFERHPWRLAGPATAADRPRDGPRWRYRLGSMRAVWSRSVDTGFWRRQHARTPLSVASTWEQGSHGVAPSPGLAYRRRSPVPTGRPLHQASAMCAANWTAHRMCCGSASSARMGRGDVLEPVTTNCAGPRCTRCVGWASWSSIVRDSGDVSGSGATVGGELAVEALSSAGLSVACDHEREQPVRG